MEGDPVIPAPDADDDDDVAWALQTAAIQWQRGQRADAVVWLRRAVDASISAGRADRTRALTRLAANVADRLVSEALAVPDSKAPPSRTAQHDSDVDELLARSSAPPRGAAPRLSPPRAAARSASDIPVEFDADDAEIIDDDLEDDLDDFEDDFDEDASPTLPPPQRAEQSSVRHELSSREYEYEEAAEQGRRAKADDVDYLDDDDTESIVDATELLSERPGPRGPSTLPGVAPAPTLSSQRPSQGARSPQASRSSQSSRPPESAGARASSPRATSSSRPAPDRTTANSWPPMAAARSGSGRPGSSSRPPANTGARSASDRPAQGARSSQSSRPPESGGTPSDRARSPSDQPIEPIVTAEELFRQRALAESRKPASGPPAKPSTGVAPPKPKQSPLPPPPFVAPPGPAEPARSAAPAAAAGAGSEQPIVDGVSLDAVRGFEDLPEASQLSLARSAILTTLSTDEEVGSFAAALVTRGRVGIMPAIADISSSVAKPGEIVFTRGTLSEGVLLRVVGLESQTVVASWSDEALNAAMADCPWVADELRLVADRFQSQAGAVLGPLGDRLDDVLRDMVLSRLEVRAFAAGEVVVEEGKPVPGLHIVGAGRVEIVTGDGPVTEASPGELLFGAEVLGAGKAHATARAGKTGALILFAARAAAHELLLGVPPLIEMLAE